MIAGAPGDVATNAETMLAGVRSGGNIPVPGRAKRHDLLDAAFLGGTAAHGIELDDGYRVGSAHCGCTVVPAALSVGYERAHQRRAADRGGGRRLRGRDLPRARLRARSAPARLPSDQRGRPVRRRGRGRQAARAHRHSRSPTRSASRRAPSAGLFAFVNGGADIKRLHAGHASREGIQAALLAELGVQGPPNVVEARDGFMQAFAFGRSDKARADRAAARRAVRHHGLLHQALCVLPPHPARRRGAVRPDERREDRGRRHQARRRRDLSHRRRARAHRLGRLRQRAAELPVSDGARGALPRHQGASFQRGNAAPIRRSASSPSASPSRRRPRSTGFIRSCVRRA